MSSDSFRSFLERTISKALFEGAMNHYEIELSATSGEMSLSDAEIEAFHVKTKKLCKKISRDVADKLEAMNIMGPDDVEDNKGRIKDVLDAYQEQILSELSND